MMNLNIGSHNVRLKDYLNVDILPLENVDLVCDITQTPWQMIENRPELKTAHPVPGSMNENGTDAILMVEVLEHLSFHDTNRVLKEIHRVLKPGGTIHIQVPDCGSMMEMYVNDQIDPRIPHKPQSEEQVLKLREETGKAVHPTRWLMAFCGAQKYGVPDIHKNIFTKQRMEDALEEAGFNKIDFKEDPLRWKIKVTATK